MGHFQIHCDLAPRSLRGFCLPPPDCDKLWILSGRTLLYRRGAAAAAAGNDDSKKLWLLFGVVAGLGVDVELVPDDNEIGEEVVGLIVVELVEEARLDESPLRNVSPATVTAPARINIAITDNSKAIEIANLFEQRLPP